MAKTLTIAGSNFLPRYKTNSATIRELIQNKAGVMNMEINVKSGQTKPAVGSEIVFKDGARFLFGGYITKVDPTETGKGQLFNFKVEAGDYSTIFNNKVARRAYTNETLHDIVADLMSTYVDSAYGFDVSNVATGPTLASVSFDHISLRTCFENLAKLTGYVWYTDYQKKLYWKATDVTAAPESITDATSNFSEITISYDNSQVRNAVTVIGNDAGEPANAPTVQHFTGNSLDRIWGLDDRPASVNYVKINGVAQQVNNKNNEIEGDQVLYSNDDVYFYLETSEPTPGAVDIEISYYPYVDVIAEKQDATSIATIAALDGGDGVCDYTIKDQAITTKAAAADRALQELAQFANPLVTGQFVTRTGLLSGGSYFKVGQYVTINLPTYGISSDSAFLIQEVNTELNEDSATSTDQYIYTVRFGGKLIGVQEFLESLSAQVAGINVNVEADIKTIEFLSDRFVAVDSGLSMVKATPPYKYGNSGTPRGKWNESEWA